MCDRQAVQSRLAAGLGLDAPGILRKSDEAAGAFDLHRLARDAHGKRRIKPAGPARRFEERDTDTFRRRCAKARIGDGGDRYADAGKSENPRIVLLARQVARAFARGIADIAKHKQIAKSGAGKAGEIRRFAGPQAMHEAAGRVGKRMLIRIGFVHFARKRRIDRHVALGREIDKALCQIDVAGGKRIADLTLGDITVKACGKRLVGDGHWIVVCRHALVRGNAAAQEKGRGNRKQRAKRGGGRRMAAEINEAGRYQVFHCGRDLALDKRRLRLFQNTVWKWPVPPAKVACSM